MRIPHRNDPALARGLTRARYSRRDALKLSGLAAAGLALAGCSIKGQQRAALSVDDFWADKKSSGRLRFANWPLYMDSERTQLKQFTEATGTKVTYKEAVQDNPSFFGQIQPQLANGDSIGYDLMVLTSGVELTKLIALGYLAPLDHAMLPNFAEHAGELYKNTAYDPGNQFCVPYASGITGIAYNPDYVDREITSIADLWDPAFEGRVGMMKDPQEIGNFGMLLNGVAPAESTPDDWKAAAAKLSEQREKGIVRAYYEQDYIQPLTNGNVWMTMAWSGDVFQQNAAEGTNLKFVIPEEGGTIWTDNMMIPITAQNPVDAITLMDFLYAPEIAAGLAEYINYVTPVPAAREVLLDKAAEAGGEDADTLRELAESPLVFPSDEDYARLHNYVSLPADEADEYTSVFLAITQA
ncbi:spermidine/putrescine transport system substrate-binding protein [Spinactinospora alkalitolerans]|uniref:Spermidine/putrescine transport system substrate-binding protein n=1 Tax=Spinactinospora alkalitolerans TaxID=687207 RepID=A0A852TLW6_9ACTN|nr:spermidine/putrescine ABC transporter substrate-binding protein [Spinactinospora alkalitolerans]NYE45236.1 spermidine/putrescine transport system substrate-binding protein [Spinactinospora alkalitolerans]